MKRNPGVLFSLMFWFAAQAFVSAQSVKIYPQLWHTSPVRQILWSPDGQRVVTGDISGIIKIWDVLSGRLLYTLTGHRAYLTAMIPSPGGSTFASGSADDTARIWETKTGRELFTLMGHSDTVNSLAYRPDGRRLATGSGDKSVKIWSTETGAPVLNLTGHSGAVYAVAYSPDGKRLVSTSSNQEIKVWDADTGREIFGVKGQWGISAVSFNPAGSTIITGSYGDIRVWDAANGTHLKTFSGHSGSFFFSRDGKQIIIDDGRVLYFLDAESGDETRTLTKAALLTDVSVKDSSVLEQDSSALPPFISAGLTQAVMTGRGDRIVAGYDNGVIVVWDAEKGAGIRSIPYAGSLYSLALSPDGAKTIGSFYSNLVIWETATGEILREIRKEEFDVTRAIYSPDGKRILSGSQLEENPVVFWDAENGREIRPLAGVTMPQNLAFSPDGKKVLFGGWDSLMVLDADTGARQSTFTDRSGFAAFVYSPDGTKILYGNYTYNSKTTTIKTLNAQTGAELRSFSIPTLRLSTLAWSRDGRKILCGFDEGNIKVLDAVTGVELVEIGGHAGRIVSLQYTPEDRQILAASVDGSVRLWSAQSGAEIVEFVTFANGEWVCLTPDGYYHASPKGEQYLNVRDGGAVYGIEQYRSTYNKPNVVADRLAGK